jgi:hypothetical protein
MAWAVYMDAHVPAAITAGLRRRGLNVLTSQEDGTDRLADDRLLERASELNRVLFSQDDDMLRLASERQRTGRPFGGVIYAHQLSAGIGTLVEDLELVLTCSDPSEVVSRVVFLPLR